MSSSPASILPSKSSIYSSGVFSLKAITSSFANRVNWSKFISNCGSSSGSFSGSSFGSSFFGSSRYPTGLTLPSFDVLQKGGASYRSKNKPFFSFRIINAAFAESEVKIRAIKSSKEQIDFVINFPKMSPNTIFQYEWAWGSPDLFPITQKDLAPGKRTEDRDSVLSELPNIVGGYKNFIYTLRFEEFADFIEKPVMNVYHKSTGEIIKDREFELQKSALYTNFVAKEVHIGILHGADIVARWVPKQ